MRFGGGLIAVVLQSGARVQHRVPLQAGQAINGHEPNASHRIGITLSTSISSLTHANTELTEAIRRFSQWASRGAHSIVP